MRSIRKSRLGRASAMVAIAGLAIVAGGAAAEARWDGYYDGWGYRQCYSHPAWPHRHYYYGYAPGYGSYRPPAVAYAQPYYGPSYSGPSLNLSIPLR